MGPNAGRLLERFKQVPAVDAVPSRAGLLKRLGELTLSENEPAMDRMGFQSIGQVLAQKFWYRLAYHLYRKFPDQSLTLSPAIEETTGTGIDLVAASVVIHYDRWWNSAREDQATDRAHRIGQQRGVHVFKLVTTGTLEEEISAIIEKKKNLLEAIVQEDDPNLLKTFTREELLELIS